MRGLAMAALGVAAASLGSSSFARAVSERHEYRRPARRFNFGSFDPFINRHTGQPHEHKREIARRLRQEAKIEFNYVYPE